MRLLCAQKRIFFEYDRRRRGRAVTIAVTTIAGTLGAFDATATVHGLFTLVVPRCSAVGCAGAFNCVFIFVPLGACAAVFVD